ncbi:AraC family transcriptional regulator [Pseudobutyrivibrio sp.]|uniref:AraC family transcriptional regulator n=1 Tax=Pseudobutyrivibrio sp. TaxID=2014367 RepID=UPI001DF9367F|nr:AraC family transcriptional regulator [Pseudobutyrivibrio sp.]MBE5910692.1 helix-turn-helix domain-containing protein [Pseudobutyrivibrio sp.]
MDLKSYQHEVVVTDAGLPFKLFSFEGANGGYVRDKHWHRSIEIFAVWEGRLEFCLHDKKVPLSNGEFVIVNSNEVHSISAPNPNRTVVLQIPQDTFADYFTDDQFIWFSHGDRESDHRVFTLLQEMYLINSNGEEGNKLQVLSLYYELLYLLVTKYRKFNVNDEILNSNKQLKKLSNITRYMKDHYAEPLSLEMMADQFNYSPSYLSRMFQKDAGINFKDYLLSIRLEHAVRELEETGGQIVDIALGNGFPNSKAFSNAFRDKYGVLPSEYRKNKSED